MRPYGQPSLYESRIQRRPWRGLSQLGGNSASFAPLQSMFGTITPAGPHYERHHQGWQDIDPAWRRLMINAAKPALLKMPMVYTLDDLMRLPPVSRIQFLECGGDTGFEWGHVAVAGQRHGQRWPARRAGHGLHGEMRPGCQARCGAATCRAQRPRQVQRAKPRLWPGARYAAGATLIRAG